MTEKLLLDINDSIGRIELLLSSTKSAPTTPTTTVDSAVIGANSRTKNSKKSGLESLDPSTYDSVTAMLKAMSGVSDSNAGAISNITDTLNKLSDVIQGVDTTKLDSVTDTISSISSALFSVGFKLSMATPFLLTSRMALPLAETIITRLSALPNITKDLSGTTQLLKDVSSIASGLASVGLYLTLATPLLITAIPGLLLTTTVVLPLLGLLSTTAISNHSAFQGMQESICYYP